MLWQVSWLALHPAASPSQHMMVLVAMDPAVFAHSRAGGRRLGRAGDPAGCTAFPFHVPHRNEQARHNHNSGTLP